MDQTYGTPTAGADDRSPAGGERTIVVMFDTITDAERARGELERAGVAHAKIDVHRRPDTATAADTADDESWWDAIKRLFMPVEDAHTYREGIRRGGAVLIVHVDEAGNDAVIDVVERCGAVDVDERSAQWRNEGWTPGERVEEVMPGPVGTASARPAGIADQPHNDTVAEPETRIPIAREALRVGKREVGVGHVRVRAYTVERPVTEAVTLRHEHVDVERRPASGAASATDAFRDRTIELDETREEAVVSKEARVEEEVVVRKREEAEKQTITDKVRETKVEVDDQRKERVPGQRKPG